MLFSYPSKYHIIIFRFIFSTKIKCKLVVLHFAALCWLCCTLPYTQVMDCTFKYLNCVSHSLALSSPSSVLRHGLFQYVYYAPDEWKVYLIQLCIGHCLCGCGFIHLHQLVRETKTDPVPEKEGIYHLSKALLDCCYTRWWHCSNYTLILIYSICNKLILAHISTHFCFKHFPKEQNQLYYPTTQTDLTLHTTHFIQCA